MEPAKGRSIPKGISLMTYLPGQAFPGLPVGLSPGKEPRQTVGVYTLEPLSSTRRQARFPPEAGLAAQNTQAFAAYREN
jgi:hypothetical protein